MTYRTRVAVPDCAVQRFLIHLDHDEHCEKPQYAIKNFLELKVPPPSFSHFSPVSWWLLRQATAVRAVFIPCKQIDRDRDWRLAAAPSELGAILSFLRAKTTINPHRPKVRFARNDGDLCNNQESHVSGAPSGPDRMGGLSIEPRGLHAAALFCRLSGPFPDPA